MIVDHFIPRLTALSSLYPSRIPYAVLLSDCNEVQLTECLHEAGGAEGRCWSLCGFQCPRNATLQNCGYSFGGCCTCLNQCVQTFEFASQICDLKYGCAPGNACRADMNPSYTGVELCCPQTLIACGGRCRSQFCPAEKSYDPRICDCACNPKTCPGAQVVDRVFCDCVCPNLCVPPFVNDPYTCDCVCPTGLTDCDGICVDTSLNRNNCGMCGTICLPNEDCCHGSCARIDVDEQCGHCDAPCSPDQTCCTSASGRRGCVNLQNDRNNCGTCNTPCGFKQC